MEKDMNPETSMAPSQEINCISRFDRLPFKGNIVGVIVLLAVVSILEAFDIGIIGQTVLVLKSHWNLTPAQTGMPSLLPAQRPESNS